MVRKKYKLESVVKDRSVLRSLQKALDGDGTLSYQDTWSIIRSTMDGKGVTQQEVDDVRAIFLHSKSADVLSLSLVNEFTRDPRRFLTKTQKIAPIIVGIDGTGPGDDEEYRLEMADSFVHRLSNRGTLNSKYYRGPNAIGTGLGEAIELGTSYIVGRLGAGIFAPILLTGYSRGATGVVCVAKRLQSRGIGVDALMMFDCVDRHLSFDAEIIPSNVRFVHHVMRSRRSGSRKSFGYEGLRYHPSSTVYSRRYFVCTHGGMGGAPWKPDDGQSDSDYVDEGFPDGKTNVTFKQDQRVSKVVWSDCQPYLRLHRFLK